MPAAATGRQTGGQETWARLRDWQRGQPHAERLAGHILRSAGYTAIDPSHPLGGPDGLKDFVCVREGRRFIAAAYFPTRRVPPGRVRTKFLGDLRGVAANEADGIAFITNQEMTLGQRTALLQAAGDVTVDLFHLGRVAEILDQPINYGVRVEYLDIPMSLEEQVAFAQAQTEATNVLLGLLRDAIARLPAAEAARLAAPGVPPNAAAATVVPFPLTGSPYGVIAFGGAAAHKRCSVCGFGFIVRTGEGLGVVTAYVPFGTPRFVTCPKCGNVDPSPV